MPIRKQQATVAEYLSAQLDACGKTQREVAREIGYDNPNIITMFKQGRTRVPLNQAGAIASALGINPAHFMRMVLEEYMPETWKAVERALGQMILSADEEQLVLTYRDMQIGDASTQANCFREA